MKNMIPILALLAVSLPAQAQQTALPQLNLIQESTLRCSAAFGLIAYDQKRGTPGADTYPPLGARGREFFVRTTARLMDETGAGREVVQALLKQRVEELQRAPAESNDPKVTLGGVVRACLPLLDAEVPSVAKR